MKFFKLETSVDLYQNQVENKIVAIPTQNLFNWSIQNIGNVSARGIDFSIQALKTFNPGLIIADYMLPTFDGLSALKIRQGKCPFTPFVIFTGSMNEGLAG